MASLGEVNETGELVLVFIGVFLVYKALTSNSISEAISQLTSNPVVGPNQFASTSAGGSIPDGQPLTAGQARSIALVVSGSVTDYNISPDGMQVWFFDGSYYDVRTGHVYSANGNDLGPLANFAGGQQLDAELVGATNG